MAETGEEVLTVGKLRICFAVLFDLTDWALDRTDLSFDLKQKIIDRLKSSFGSDSEET